MSSHPIMPEQLASTPEPSTLDRLVQVITHHPWPLILLLFGVGVPIWAFGALADSVWEHEGFSWDKPIQLFVHSYATPQLDQIMSFLAIIGSPQVLVVPLVILCVALYLRKRIGSAVFLLLGGGGAIVLNVLIKLVFHRARPTLWVSPTILHDYSFPSGHAMGDMAVVVALLFLLWQTRFHWPILLFGALFIALVGLDRVYLGVHYPSDVLGAWLAGLAWVVGVRIVWSYWLGHYSTAHGPARASPEPLR